MPDDTASVPTLAPPPHASVDVNSEEWRTWFYKMRAAIVTPEYIEVGGGSGSGGSGDTPDELTKVTYSISNTQTIPNNAHYILAYSSNGPIYLTIPEGLESTYLHIKKMSGDTNEINVSASTGVDGGSMSIKYEGSAMMLAKTTDGWKVL